MDTTQKDLARDTATLMLPGALLFLIGLLNGAAIPALESPRLGLAAHTAGVQNGMVLLILALAWRYQALPPRASAIAWWSNLAGMYGIWLGLLLAALWGAGRAAPMAGAGLQAEPWQEMVAQGVVTTGAVASANRRGALPGGAGAPRAWSLPDYLIALCV